MIFIKLLGVHCLHTCRHGSLATLLRVHQMLAVYSNLQKLTSEKVDDFFSLCKWLENDKYDIGQSKRDEKSHSSNLTIFSLRQTPHCCSKCKDQVCRRSEYPK
jgi:hypothetical protein